MAWQVTEAVIKHSRSKGGARLLLCVLAYHANADGICDPAPKLPLLVEETKMSLRAVRDSLRALEETEEIHYVPGSGRGKNSFCRILLPLANKPAGSIKEANAASFADDNDADRMAEKGQSSPLSLVTPLSDPAGPALEKGQDLPLSALEKEQNLPQMAPEKGQILHSLAPENGQNLPLSEIPSEEKGADFSIKGADSAVKGANSAGHIGRTVMNRHEPYPGGARAQPSADGPPFSSVEPAGENTPDRELLAREGLFGKLAEVFGVQAGVLTPRFEAQLNQQITELRSMQATPDLIATFVAQRRRLPGVSHFADDFRSWLADRARYTAMGSAPMPAGPGAPLTKSDRNRMAVQRARERVLGARPPLAAGGEVIDAEVETA